MSINVAAVIGHLNSGDLTELFAEELGWNRPSGTRPISGATRNGTAYSAAPVAELVPYAVFEVRQNDLPDYDLRKAIQTDLAKTVHESILIFTNSDRSQQSWQWLKRDGKKQVARSHAYFRGTGGLEFVSKLSSLAVDLEELDERGKLPLVEAAQKVAAALDNEKVTKRFFTDFADKRVKFAEAILGIPNERDRNWYVSVLVNRLLFIYFLQKRLFLDGGNPDYLEDKLAASKNSPGVQTGDRFYRDFLYPLFFEAFAKPDNPAQALTGRVPYLNGGLFLMHELESKYPIQVKDSAFDALFELFGRYNWAFHAEAGQPENTISPGVLGYIFEKYINQKEFGAYYTRPQITQYLCRQTIHQIILDKVKTGARKSYPSIEEMLFKADASMCRLLLEHVLPSIKVLDPACGSGAFLVAALETIVNVYDIVAGRAHLLEDPNLREWIAEHLEGHRSRRYEIHKQVIMRNLFGVDLMPEACEIARLRLFMSLVACVDEVEKLEPLPNIDFNIMAGNSLVGLLRVDDKELAAQGSLFALGYPELVNQKMHLVRRFQNADARNADPTALRAEIDKLEQETRPVLDEILTERFHTQGVKYERATWDEKAGKEGKPARRAVTLADVQALQPFHWSFEFSEAMRAGGFDAIITNPPWKKLKPEDKEFFQEHSGLVSKNKMTIKDFEKERDRLMPQPELREAYLDYLSRFPHQSAYFRTSPQFANQSTLVGGKKTGGDVDVYKLFTEQSFNLMRQGGLCGIVLKGGIHLDLAAAGLRKMLMDFGQITQIIGLSNEKYIFENVHHAERITLLSFRKGGRSDQFPAAFRINPRDAIRPEELEDFLSAEGPRMVISVDDVRRASPETLAVREFRSTHDESITLKILKHPRLGASLSDVWNLRLTREFDMTNDSHLFHTSPGLDRLPLYEGKMIWQFTHQHAPGKYFVIEDEGRSELSRVSQGVFDYTKERLAYREIAASTNERTVVATFLPPRVFANHKLHVVSRRQSTISPAEELYVCSIWNSYLYDHSMRMQMSTGITMATTYSMPVPRLTAADPAFWPIVERAARLICTTEEFADLWKEVFAKGEQSATGTFPGLNTGAIQDNPAAAGCEPGSAGFSRIAPVFRPGIPPGIPPNAAPAAAPDGLPRTWTPACGATDPAERARLRAELDGLVAHLYGLTEEEFAHILTTFPLVKQEVKDAAMAEFQRLAA